MKHFSLADYIEDEAEVESDCSKDEEDNEECEQEPEGIDEAKKINLKKNMKVNRKKFREDEIEKEELLIKKIMKRTYKAKTQDTSTSIQFQKKDSTWMKLNQKALILSQSNPVQTISPVKEQSLRTRIGFKCNKNNKDTREEKKPIIQSAEKGSNEIEELKKDHEQKIIKKISQISSAVKRSFRERLKEDDEILENVIKVNSGLNRKPSKENKVKRIPFGFPGKHTSLLKDLKENKLNESQ